MSTSGVVRVGDTVRRPVKEKSAFVHDVLRHLELRGFDRVPRFLGIDEKGRAMLTYISGTVPHQVGGFQKEQWLAAARLLRLFHDATVDCELKGECEVICHGDPSPGNYVLRDGMPFALIDFDGAHPGKREEDVGYAAWMWLHIGNRKVAPEEQGRTWWILWPRTMQPRPGTRSEQFFKLSTSSWREYRTASSGRSSKRGRKPAWPGRSAIARASLLALPRGLTTRRTEVYDSQVVFSIYGRPAVNVAYTWVYIKALALGVLLAPYPSR